MFKSTKKTALGHPNQQIKKYNYLIISDLYKNRDHNCRSQVPFSTQKRPPYLAFKRADFEKRF
jgi:hypothetical protein